MTRTTYLVALVDGGGTVPPELGVVTRLVDAGHDVTVLAEDSMRSEVVATGATFRPWVAAPNRPDRLPEHDPYRDWECRTPLGLFDRLVEHQFVGPAARYATDVEAAVADRRPDVVVSSFFALGAMVAAEAAGIPFRVLMPNIYMLPAPGMPPFGLGLHPARGALGRTRDRLITSFSTRLWDRKGLGGLNQLRASRGLAPLSHLWDQLGRGERLIVLTSPAFDFPAELPDTVRYVGPVLDDPAWTEAWIPPAGDAPLVLVAMSSTFQDQVPSLQRVVDALAALPVRVLVTTGQALDPDAVRAAANTTVVRSAPHREVLPHAAVVVTHGGHGTVVKALVAGVPLVVLPHGRDQADNAARVVVRGAGLTLKRTAKPSAITRAVRTVLDDPSYRRNASELGAKIARDADGDELLRALEVVAHQHC